MWFLLGLIVLTYIINKISLNLGFENLEYSLELLKTSAEIDEEIPVVSTITNRKLLTISFLEITELFPDSFVEFENKHAMYVLPYQRVKRRYSVIAKKRGIQRALPTALELGDFIGLNSIKKSEEVNTSIVILPKRIDLDESLMPLGALNGDTSVKRWILDDPLMNIGIREYTGSEPMKHIHWGSSARIGELMVKQFDFTTDNSTMVILNCETMKPCWKPIEADLIEKAISIARGIVETLEEGNSPYGFTTNARKDSKFSDISYDIHPGLGDAHLEDVLLTLGEIDYKVVSFFENTLEDIIAKKGHYSTVVIVTGRLLDTYIEPINRLDRTVTRTIVVSLDDSMLDSLSHGIIKIRGK